MLRRETAAVKMSWKHRYGIDRIVKNLVKIRGGMWTGGVFMEADRFSVETCSHQLTDEREEALVVEQIKYLQSELCSVQSSFLAIISVSLGAYG